jgi:nucleotide-binding universal stress UspA family protein
MDRDADTRPVVVAFDGSDESIEAARSAATLFRDRPLLVVTVWEPGLAMAIVPTGGLDGAGYIPPTPEEIDALDEAQHDHAQAVAEAGARVVSDEGATAEALPVPDSTDIPGTILAIAEQRDAAAVVVGSRGHGRVKSLFEGSTSRRLLHDAHRPVVVVRADRGGER